MAQAKKAKPAARKALSKAKVPMAAGAAALAGAAGGALIGARQTRRRHRLGETAKGLGNLGLQVGALASELQRSREGGNGNTHRSPIEVVLEGLTARRERA